MSSCGGPVDGMVVDDGMDNFALWPLLMPLPLHPAPDQRAIQDVADCEQYGGAMPLWSGHGAAALR
jgi:hypothetical protein